MNNHNALPPLQEINSWNLSQIQSFVREIWDNLVKSEESLRQANWWLGLAQIAAAKALSDNEPNRLSWAQLVVEIYERIAGSYSDEGIERDLMFFRAKFLVKHQREIDEKIWNLEEIIKWVLDSLTVSPEKIRAEIPFTPEKLAVMDLSYIRQLRKIKNRLSILKYLKENHKLAADETFEKWLELREELP